MDTAHPSGADDTLPRLFVSHSTRDRELVDKFIDLLVTGAGLSRDAVFASSLPDRGIPLGQEFVDHIKNELTRAALVVFVVSQDFYRSRFCICEMGAAWALGKRVAPLLVRPLQYSDVAEVFAGAQLGLLYSSADLDSLKVVIENVFGIRTNVEGWNPKRDQFLDYLAMRDADARERADVLDRGDVLESIVDSAIYVAPDTIPELRSQIVRHLRTGEVLPTTYSYVSDSGLHHWIELTGDPGYVAYHESIGFFAETASEIAALSEARLKKRSIDFVSLGPGTGQKDQKLLAAFVARLERTDAPLYYYPFDINPEMITTAVRRVTGDRDLTARLRIKAVVADFQSLTLFKPVYQYRQFPNCVVLLGNTLGNMRDDRGFLEKLYESAMLPQDILLLEVRTRGGQGAMGNEALNKKFDFGPLELLGVEYNSHKLTYKSTEGRSVIPKTVTTVATYAEVRYRGQTFRDVKLSYVHQYDVASLRAVAQEIGFEVVKQYENEFSAVLVLARPV